MQLAFKYLRIITAITLMICVVVSFVIDLHQQSKTMLDGPLAHYFSYTLALNKIVLAAFLSVVLLFDFQIYLPSLKKRLLRIIGVICILLSLLGFALLVKHQLFSGSAKMLGELYLFQFAYLLISIVIFGKSCDSGWSYLNSKELTDA